MMGNDVVDLKVAAAESNWRRKGFLRKVFLKEERDLVWTAKNQHQMVWLLWSMKEAAYKARQRQFSLPRHLNWQSLQCSLKEISGGKASGMVKVGEELYSTVSDLTLENIHTTANQNSEIPLKNFIFKAPSAATKKELLQQTANLYSFPVADLYFRKNKHGVPYISYKEQVLSTVFSLSDHGRFSAFSLSLRMS